MSTRRTSASIFASPVLVGAITILVVTIAVFLAYNANNGLPFVPTRELKVQFRSGAELVKGNEVREGGFRVGVVTDVQPVMLQRGGVVGALATLKLDKKAGAFPTDTVATIRPRSALGLKYVELQRGQSRQSIADGSTLPESQTRSEVELDQVYGMFDDKTRAAAQTDLKEFGDAFTGRGLDLNNTIRGLPRTLGLLNKVTTNLADPRTNLQRFFPSLERTAAVIAPLADTFAKGFTYMADTFGAFARYPNGLRDTIAKSPGTLQAGTESFHVQTPFLRDTAAFSKDLNKAVIELRRALPDLNGALRVGIPVTKRSVQLYGDLQGALTALRDLAQAPTTNAALRGLTATVATLQPTIRFLGPFITVCNYWNTFWNNLASVVSVDTPQGTAQGSLTNSSTSQNHSLTNLGSSIPANGEGTNPVQGGTPEYFHGAPYGHSVDNAGNADCVYGQTGFIHKYFKYDPMPTRNKGSAAGTPGLNIDIDPKPPDWLGHPTGPTYAHYDAIGHGLGLGPTHVPAGETFTALPGGIAPDPLTR